LDAQLEEERQFYDIIKPVTSTDEFILSSAHDDELVELIMTRCPYIVWHTRAEIAQYIRSERENDERCDMYYEWEEDDFELTIDEFPEETPEDIIVEAIMATGPMFHTRESIIRFVHNYHTQ
jgi:hypothetical protein